MATLNHIGIASSAIPGMAKLFALLGLKVTHVEPVPEQGVVAHFLPLPADHAHLELLEPLDPEGTVAQFLKKRGPGIHHLAFEVVRGELDELCNRLRTEGYRLIFPQAKPGAQGARVNFIHPASAGGILIEIMEPN